jgi:hypothetical protein
MWVNSAQRRSAALGSNARSGGHLDEATHAFHPAAAGGDARVGRRRFSFASVRDSPRPALPSGSPGESRDTGRAHGACARVRLGKGSRLRRPGRPVPRSSCEVLHHHIRSVSRRPRPPIVKRDAQGTPAFARGASLDSCGSHKARWWAPRSSSRVIHSPWETLTCWWYRLPGVCCGAPGGSPSRLELLHEAARGPSGIGRHA